MVIQLKDYAKHGIQITPWIDPDPKERIVYDLHVGESYRRPGDANRKTMPRMKTLWPNTCIRIDTQEKLTTSTGVFGQTCSRASLSAEGLVVANLKIDPKFAGHHLCVTAFNTGKRPIRIKRDDPFCSIFFSTLEEHVGQDAEARNPPEAGVLATGWVEETLIRAAPFVVTFGLSVAVSLASNYIARWAVYLLRLVR